MSEFESWKQYSEFSHFVMKTARHILDAKNLRFLDTVIQTSEKRKGCIREGVALWRAQLGHGWRTQTIHDENQREVDSFPVEGPFSRERMVPQSDRAHEGR